MPRAFTPKVITANALLDGDVVYLSPTGAWVRDLRDAELFTDEAVADLTLLDASKRAAEVVGVYLADMKPTADGPEPSHFREAFRRKGPSNYPHGKQADI